MDDIFSEDLTCLERLRGSGVKVEADGRLTDWSDQPAAASKPAGSDPVQQKALRNKWLSDEKELLQNWSLAAEAQGRGGGSGVYEQLEVMVSSTLSAIGPHSEYL